MHYRPLPGCRFMPNFAPGKPVAAEPPCTKFVAPQVHDWERPLRKSGGLSCPMARRGRCTNLGLIRLFALRLTAPVRTLAPPCRRLPFTSIHQLKILFVYSLDLCGYFTEGGVQVPSGSHRTAIASHVDGNCHTTQESHTPSEYQAISLLGHRKTLPLCIFKVAGIAHLG